MALRINPDLRVENVCRAVGVADLAEVVLSAQVAILLLIIEEPLLAEKALRVS